MDNLAVHEDMGQPMYIMWNNSKYSNEELEGGGGGGRGIINPDPLSDG